tara:strand:- start:131 stop:334 length:204 start_codon:yes stop_codon:yes gene_type:complete
MNERMKAVLTLALEFTEAERKQLSAALILSTLNELAIEDVTDEAIMRARQENAAIRLAPETLEEDYE